jgi:maltose-binding protein MalE
MPLNFLFTKKFKPPILSREKIFRPIILLGILLVLSLGGCNFPRNSSDVSIQLTQVVKQPTATPIRSDQLPNFATPVAAEQDPLQNSKITLWHGLTRAELLTLHEVVSVYQRQFPNTSVTLRYVPYDDLYAAFSVAEAAPNETILLIGPGEWGPTLFDTGAIGDISSYATPEFLAGLNEPATTNNKYQNSLIGLPFSLTGVVMFRNRAIFPTAPVSIAQMEQMALNISAGNTVGTFLDHSPLYSLPHLTACQGRLMHADGTPAFNTPAGLCWLNLLKSFNKFGLTTYNTNADLDQFLAGRVGIIFEGTWEITTGVNSLGTDLMIDPWPIYAEEPLSGYVWSQSIYMAADLSLRAESVGWKFMEFFLSEEAQLIWASSGKIPALYPLRMDDPLLLQASVALSGAIPFPLKSEFEVYWQPLSRMISVGVQNNSDAANALQIAYDEIETLVQRMHLEQLESRQ